MSQNTKTSLGEVLISLRNASDNYRHSLGNQDESLSPRAAFITARSEFFGSKVQFYLTTSFKHVGGRTLQLNDLLCRKGEKITGEKMIELLTSVSREITGILMNLEDYEKGVEV